MQVASTLRAVVVQTLISRASGHGRAPATEVMINTPAVAALIRGGKAHQIRTVLQSGEKEGMHTLDQDLARLVNKGVITFEDALAKVQVLEEFENSAAPAPPSDLAVPIHHLYTYHEQHSRNTNHHPARRFGEPRDEPSKRLFTWFAEQRLHCIVFIAYVTVTVTVSCFHEPWFDEAQAWLIARDCSWKELLTVRTHYEGHPPLWWMLLAIPAKLGMPYEIGLKSLNLMCAALMIWLLEFKTKLPELLKVILPFSYFLCYQYGVTSRPYALMIAAMLLIAINWNNRNTKPWPVILSMMLLCATSSYGLAIAGMLALNWTIQFLCGERSLIKTSSVSRDLFCYWYSPSYCSSTYSPHPAHTTVTLTYMALQQHHPHGFPYSTPGW